MNIKVIGSTKPNYFLDKNDALDFSGKASGICYMKEDIDTLFLEDKEKTKKRVAGNIEFGHHSVFNHVTYNLVFENIPKILAMILNNEKVYNTSEKSARYTTMQLIGSQKNLYEKWTNIFEQEIQKKYPTLKKLAIQKLAKENARYFISIFAPATTMEYSCNFGQLNYIINWAKDYISNNSTKKDIFSIKLCEVLSEFLVKMPDIEVEGLNSNMKNRCFSLFATRTRNQEFGENYCTNYIGSYAMLAQAQRHRTLSYEFSFLDENSFYIPPIIKNTPLENMYLEDMTSCALDFPQGMNILINERGSIENFVLKCTERVCGAAQLEIMNQTIQTLDTYANNLDKTSALYEYLKPYLNKSRCLYPNFKCTNPCFFGSLGALTRVI